MNPFPLTPANPATVDPDAAPAPAVQVISPAGEIFTTTADKIPEAVQSGLRVATPQDIAKAANQEKYGGALGQVGAALQGGASGLTFGATDYLDKDLAKHLKDANPNAYGAGQIIAPVAAAIATGGASAAAEGAAGAAEGAGLLSKIAGATPAGLVGRLGEAAAAPVAEGLGGGLAARAIGGAVRGAVETPFYSAGDAVSENALSDTPGDFSKVAEHIIASVTPAAFFGAGVGGGADLALGIAGRALPAAFDKISSGAQSLADRFAKAPADSAAEGAKLVDMAKPVYEAGRDLTATAEPDINDRIGQQLAGRDTSALAEQDAANQRKAAFEVPEYDTNPARAAFRGSLDTQGQLEASFFKQLYDVDRPAAIRGALETPDPVAAKKLNTLTQQASLKTLSDIRATLEDGTIPSARDAKVGLLLDKAESAIQNTVTRDNGGRIVSIQSDIDNAADRHLALNGLKKDMDQIAYPATGTGAEKGYYDQVKAARGQLKDFLQDTTVWGDAGNIQRDFNSVEAARLGDQKVYRNLLGASKSHRVSIDDAPFAADSDKTNALIDKMAKGGDKAVQDTKEFTSYLASAGTSLDHMKGSVLAGNPARQAEADALHEALRNVEASAKAAVDTTNSAKVAEAEAKLARLPDANKALRINNGLSKELAAAGSDTERFQALRRAYEAPVSAAENAPALREATSPALSQLRDAIASRLGDEATYETAAKSFKAIEASRAALEPARDAFEKEFTKVSGESKAVSAAKMDSYLAQAAAGKIGAGEKTKALQDFVGAVKNHIETMKGEVYNHLAPGKMDDVASKVIDDIEGQRGAAIAAKTADIAHGQPPGSLGDLVSVVRSAKREGMLAIGTHILGAKLALPVWAIATILRNPTQALHVLGMTAGHMASVSSKLSSVARSALSGASAGAVAPQVSAYLRQAQVINPPRDNETRAQSLKRIGDDLSTLAANPAAIRDRVAQNAPQLAFHAPGIFNAAVANLTNQVGYLNANMPRPISVGGLPGSPKIPVSASQQAKASRMLQAAYEPLSAVENIKNGRLMPVEVQTVKALHPQLHAQIGQEMLQSLADKGERPTMQKRMAYAMWTGDTQSDPTLRMLPMLQAPSPFGDKPSGQQGPGMAKKSRASPKSPALQKIAARYAPPGASEGSEA